MNLKDKLQNLQNEVAHVAGGVKLAESGKSSITWKEVMEGVRAAESALRAVRAVVRKNLTKEKRDACPHPDRSRDQHGVCVNCRKPGLDPTPANVVCECGNPRWRHDSTDAERLAYYTEGGGTKTCSGFKKGDVSCKTPSQKEEES